MDTTSSRPPSMEVSPQGVTLSVLALLSLLVCIPPLIWHTRNRNFPAACLAGWFIVMNFFNFANPIIWPTDDMESWWKGYGYCDVHAKISVGVGAGLAGPLVCIFRSLARVLLDTDNSTLISSRAEKRRNIAFEVVFCVVIPVILMIIHYTVQDYRYAIRAITGCWPAWHQSWVSIVVGYMWPPIILLIATIYCLIVLYRLGKYKNEFSSIMSSSLHTTKSQFTRLLALSLALLIGSFPLQLYVLYSNATATKPPLPYSWKVVHGPGWGEIPTIPSQGSVLFSFWIHVAAGFFLFIFFGFGRDATLMYRSILLKFGFGRCFPSLEHPHVANERKPSDTTRIGSISSRAKLFFGKTSSQNESMGTYNTANNSSMQAITAYNSTTRFGSSVSSGKPLPKVQARDIPQYPHLEVWPNPSEGIRQEFSIPSDASTAISSPNPQHQCGNGGVRADSIV